MYVCDTCTYGRARCVPWAVCWRCLGPGPEVTGLCSKAGGRAAHASGVPTFRPPRILRVRLFLGHQDRTCPGGWVGGCGWPGLGSRDQPEADFGPQHLVFWIEQHKSQAGRWVCGRAGRLGRHASDLSQGAGR